MNSSSITLFMEAALKEAKKAISIDEVPVGAIVVYKNKIIGLGHNSVISDCSVSAHAEINAISRASSFLKNYRLNHCDLYVTLEPCHMCAKAIVDARINHIYFSALEPKTGAVVSVDNYLDKPYLNHKVGYSYGYMADDSAKLLQDFFKSKRI